MGMYLLLSPLLLVLAIVFKVYSPPKINPYFGYRTKRSMKSQVAWDEANKFASTLLVLISIILNVLQLGLFLLLQREMAFLITGILILFGVMLIIPVKEIHLRKIL